MSPRPRSPGWNAVCLLGALALALWLLAKVLAAVWPWLLLLAVAFALVWLAITVAKRFRDRL